MRIGEFSKANNLTIDTIRHYMDLELIIPEKKGAHYFFNEKCSEDLKEIVYLKEAGFSLHEIQRIFALKRLSGIKSSEDKAYYRQILMGKMSGLMEEINKLEAMILKIQNRINKIDTWEDDLLGLTLGVPLEGLTLLACPICGGNLRLSKGEIRDNMIINGELKCICSKKLLIVDGIIILDRDIIKGKSRIEDWSNREYIEKTPHEFVNFMYKTVDLIINKVDVEHLKNHVILEPGIGSGIFLSHMEEMLPESVIYIGIDYDLELLRVTKKYIENHSQHKNYIFICCELNSIPIKNQEIDIVFDYLGSTNYNFKKEGFLVDILKEKIRKGGKWYGSYFYFESYCKTLEKLNERCHPYFKLKNIIKSFENSCFKIVDKKNFGYKDKSGVFESFLIEGDRVYQEVIIGVKE